MIRQILLCITVCVVLFAVSCNGGGEERYLRFRESPFRAQISGSLNGLRFSAELCSEDGAQSICYLSPASLEGITLTRSPDGEFLVASEGISVDLEEEQMEGLWLPFSLVAEYARELQSVQKDGEHTHVILSGDVELILEKDGIPVSVKSPNAAFAILSWEKMEGDHDEK